MDKLELDDRVSRLERRVSFLSALALLALVAPAILVGSYLVMARSKPSPAVISLPAVRADRRIPPDAIAFEAELRRLHDLLQRGLITSDDFAAKKADILGRSMEFGDEAEAVEAAKALHDDNIITSADYDALKRRILKLDK